MLLLHLLLVENHENTLAGLQELLCYEGYRVRGVSNGQKAIEILAQQPVDIVLCDQSLPDIDGIQLCCQL
ncbi:MAG: response regulator transcription factor, partial [bacterium]